MEDRVLDRVYNAFSNFERDYARSKKTREQFIKDKFGGDIEIGSTIILDAISSTDGSETPEDIEKMTFIKDMITSVKSMENNLSRLSTFTNLEGSNAADELFELLNSSYSRGTGQLEMEQSQLYRHSKGEVLHFDCTVFGSCFCDLNASKIIKIYNEHIQGLVENTLRVDGSTGIGSILELRSRNHAVVVEPRKVKSILK